MSAKGAQAHWAAIPAFYHFILPTGEATVSLNLQLGLPLPSLLGVRTCHCGATIDNLGYHYLICNRRGWTLRQHDSLKDEVEAMLKSVYPSGSVQKEPTQYRDYSPNHRPDVVVRNWDGRGNYLAVDVSVTFPCASTYVARASRERLYAANKREADKARVYGDMGPHRLVTFAVESFGALGPGARGLVEQCARVRHNRLVQEAATASWSTRSFRSYWLQRFAVCLQRMIGRGVESRAVADWVP